MAQNNCGSLEKEIAKELQVAKKLLESEGSNLTVNNLGALENGSSAGDLAHIRAVNAIIKAFKGRQGMRLYIEHRVPVSSARPADILIVSKDIGFMLVEVKGFIIQNIDSVTGSTIKGDFYSPSSKELDVFHQAESSMYGFKRHYDEKARRKGTKGSPQFDFFVFFPSISVKDWEGRGYNECMSMEQLLFKEDCDHPELIAKKIYQRVSKVKKDRHDKPVLSPEQESLLLASLGESSYVIDPGEEKKIEAIRKKNPNFEINRSNVSAVESLTQEKEEMRCELRLKEEALKNTENDLKVKEKEISKLKKQREEDSKKQLSLLKDVEANKQVVLELEEAEKRRLELEEQLTAERATIDLLRENLQEKELRVSSEPERQISLGERILSYYETEKKLTPEQEEVVGSPMSSSPYLIRGVAGSGKSVVLTKHVVNRVLDAYQKYEGGLKLENPLKIGVVCFNRSLAPYLRETIVTSLKSWCDKDQSPEEVAAQYVECQSLNSFLFALSKKGYCRYKRIDVVAGGIDYDHYIREFRALRDRDIKKYDEMLFDTLYVDESQDLIPEEFQLLMEMLRPGNKGEKNLIIFYDDAQNLYGRRRPVWKDLGIKVDVGRRSKFLATCHRNTKETLDFAFNMLMGTCNGKGVKAVNMASFADVSNLKQRRLVSSEGDLYRVHFSSRSGEPVEVRGFRNRNDEMRWVYNKVLELIKKDKVLTEDILVLFPAKKMYDDLENALERLSLISGVIRPHGQDKDSFPFLPDYLTMSTIHSAKGLGAPVVFLIGVDRCQNDDRGRAAFYVGATRAKIKLFVTGVVGANSMIEESMALKKALCKVDLDI